MRWPPPQNEVYLGPGEQTSSFEAINDSTFRYFVEIDVEVPATLSPEFDQVLAGTDRRGRFVLVDERRRHASTKSIDLTLQSTTRKVLNCSAIAELRRHSVLPMQGRVWHGSTDPRQQGDVSQLPAGGI